MSVKVNAEQQFHGTKYEMFALILLKIDSIFSTCHTLQTDSHRHMLPQGFPSKAPTKSRYIKISIKYLEDLDTLRDVSLLEMSQSNSLTRVNPRGTGKLKDVNASLCAGGRAVSCPPSSRVLRWVGFGCVVLGVLSLWVGL